ncbi:hypothetical protein LX16_4582 [Stackebrandtia albiflava]|uniref:Uncharacterized protein n=1 Tax=Stackebrandtia albiflava TaxID=406432 RepID=A0A562URW8_9ACTN|nr:hypothetical protein [Stackebrandtia albiflava]TWJ08354.1 hypothetical protein LX16_4582 [Stackebrandtia albiflava]
MNFSELLQLDTGVLHSARDSASQAGSGFDAQADAMREHNKALSEIWHGPDARKAHTALAATRRPLEDFGQVFRMVSRVTDQLAERLRQSQEVLRDTIETAKTIPATVDMSTGVVTAFWPNEWPTTFESPSQKASYEAAFARNQADAESMTEALRQIVEQANRFDRDASNALARIDTPAEAKAAYQGAFGTDADTEDAETALRLFTEAGGGRLSPAEVRRLQELVGQNSQDFEFAGALLAKLGPEGLLKAYGNVALEGGLTPDFQAGMGRLLSAAMDPVNPHRVDPTFGQRMRDLVGAHVALEDDGETKLVPGHGLIAPLLETGDFESTFLVPVASDIYNAVSPLNARMAAGFDVIGPEALSPLGSVLTGLANNPSAATTFALTRPDVLKHVLTQPGERVPGSPVDISLTGRFLRVAATGYDALDAASPRSGEHNTWQAKAAAQIVALVGDQANLLRSDTPELNAFRNDMALIAAEYIEDFYIGFNTPNTEKLPTDLKPRGAPLDLAQWSGLRGDDKQPLYDFMKLASFSKEGRAVITGAALPLAQVELAKSIAREGRDSAVAINALNGFARLMGQVHNGRFAVGREEVAALNEADATSARWLKLGLGITVGYLASIAMPSRPFLGAVTASSIPEFLINPIVDEQVRRKQQIRESGLNQDQWADLRAEYTQQVELYAQVIESVRNADLPGVQNIPSQESGFYEHALTELLQEFDVQITEVPQKD